VTTDTPRLAREDWISAALDAATEGGVSAVAVEPLAKRLGVTKGSFYWHFRDRDDLLEAMLAEWERERTEAFIERLDAIRDPRRRLGEWTRQAFGADKALLVALHAAGDHPIVRPVLTRVTERRIRYLADLLHEAGVPPAAARRRARLLYSADLGLFQIGGVVSDGKPAGGELTALIREIQGAFLRD
jgi:AcrR family transcriptional regulator